MKAMLSVQQLRAGYGAVEVLRGVDLEVMPGETVRIIKPFQDFKGLFMFHCHNLEHEDMGMMRDFLVE